MDNAIPTPTDTVGFFAQEHARQRARLERLERLLAVETSCSVVTSHPWVLQEAGCGFFAERVGEDGLRFLGSIEDTPRWTLEAAEAVMRLFADSELEVRRMPVRQGLEDSIRRTRAAMTTIRDMALAAQTHGGAQAHGGAK